MAKIDKIKQAMEESQRLLDQFSHPSYVYSFGDVKYYKQVWTSEDAKQRYYKLKDWISKQNNKRR